MKAIVQTGERSVEVQERPTPTPGANEVRVAVRAAGLCGSDAHAYRYEDGYEWIEFPRIMGHEYAGVVDAVGEDVSSFEPGDHVVEEPIHDCGECFQCKNGQSNVCQDFSITGLHTDGAYAEYTVVRATHLHHVPDEIPFEHAAITEPTSIATRAVLERSDLQPGEHVLVEGPGPIGTLIALVAHSIGAEVTVSGLARDAVTRLPLLEELGLDAVDSSETALEEYVERVTDGLGFDRVFDTTGHHTGVEQASEVVRKGGQVVVVGLPGAASELSMTPLVRGEVDLTTSYGSVWRNFEQALRLMQSGAVPVGEIVDTTVSTDDPTAAFEAFLDAETVKPVFTFG